MQQFTRVNDVKCAHDAANNEVEFVLVWTATKSSQPLLEIRTVDEVQDHVRRPIDPDESIDPHDVRMLKAGKRFSLLQELLKPPIVDALAGVGGVDGAFIRAPDS